MSKLKALIYRESVILKSQYILCISLGVIIMIFSWLIRLSMKVGNIAKMIADEPDTYDMINSGTFYFGTYTVMVCFSIIVTLNIFVPDMKSRWRVFSDTLPVTPTNRLAAMYIAKIVKIIAVLAVSIINAAFMCKDAGKTFDMQIVMDFVLIIDFFLLAELIQNPLCVMAKTEKELNYAKFATSAAVFGVTGIAMMISKHLNNKADVFADSLSKKGMDEDEILIERVKMVTSFCTQLCEKAEAFAVPIMLVLLAATFGLSLLASKRRDK